MRRCLLAAIVFLVFGGTATAQEWAKRMFEVTSHDFGVVARGANAEFRFAFENPYVEDVHVESVHSTCHCTVPEIVQPLVKTYERSEIVARLDTRRFYGRREATIRVKFDKPFPAEVQLHVYSYIRSDVVLEPGTVRLGSVAQGTPQRQKVTVSYAGRSDWEILDVESARPFLSAKAVPVSRAGGQVIYDLWVELASNAPAGYLKDHLMLVTNDRNPAAKRVPVPVEGIIVPQLSARPSPLDFGTLRSGQSVTRSLIVQGKAPFSITRIYTSDTRFSFRVSEATRPVHQVPVTFTAGSAAEEIDSVIRVETNLGGGEALDVRVVAQVAPAEPVMPTNGEASSDEPAPGAEPAVQSVEPSVGEPNQSAGWHAPAK